MVDLSSGEVGETSASPSFSDKRDSYRQTLNRASSLLERLRTHQTGEPLQIADEPTEQELDDIEAVEELQALVELVPKPETEPELELELDPELEPVPELELEPENEQEAETDFEPDLDEDLDEPSELIDELEEWDDDTEAMDEAGEVAVAAAAIIEPVISRAKPEPKPARQKATRYVVVDEDAKPKQRGSIRGGGRDREEQDLVRLYMTDIGRHDLLTHDDEIRLAKAIEAGIEARIVLEEDEDNELDPAQKRILKRAARSGEDAERTFINANLRLVVSIAKKYQASGLPLLDLIQEGNLGLMHAVEKFDWRKGFKFSTYATWWIRQSITRGIANMGRTIRLPVHMGETVSKLNKARKQLELSNQEVTINGLAAIMETTPEKVVEIIRFASEPLSLNEPLKEDGDAELGDVVGDSSSTDGYRNLENRIVSNEVVDAIREGVNQREFEVLSMRFGIEDGIPKTLEDVGAHFKLTRERIRQIEAKAFAKLRHPSGGQKIRSAADMLD